MSDSPKFVQSTGGAGGFLQPGHEDRRYWPLSAAAVDVLTERRRQVEEEGWTPEHDDEHADGSLASASACYAAPMPSRVQVERIDASGGRGETPVWQPKNFRVPKLWPESWHASCWKPKDRRADLIRAGALILAEIERLDRAVDQGAAA